VSSGSLPVIAAFWSCRRPLIPASLQGQSRRYNGPVITLSANEERLVETLRALPFSAAEQMITWATRLRELSDGRDVDWSATWTEEDMADAQRASCARFEEREREEP